MAATAASATGLAIGGVIALVAGRSIGKLVLGSFNDHPKPGLPKTDQTITDLERKGASRMERLVEGYRDMVAFSENRGVALQTLEPRHRPWWCESKKRPEAANRCKPTTRLPHRWEWVPSPESVFRSRRALR